MSVNSSHAQTLELHAQQLFDPARNSVAVLIYQTMSYKFDSTELAANLFALVRRLASAPAAHLPAT